MQGMKVLILGGTGMLGYPAALEFLKRGYQVEATARRYASMSPEFDSQVKLHLVDLSAAFEAELNTLMLGVDYLVYALGPDDRETPLAPADGFFKRELVDRTERVFQAARRAGVKRAVLLGSYFCTFNRLHPEWKLEEHHPYVRARVQQARKAVASGEGWGDHLHMDVMTLEIPYVFGSTPGRVPFWKAVFFERLRRMPLVMYPRGGTVTTTTRQMGEAIVGAAERGEHGANYPIGDLNMSWNEMIRIVLDTLGDRRAVHHAPMFLAQRAMQSELKALSAEGKESGMNPLHLMQDIMYRELYLDCWNTQDLLGYAPGGVPEALRDTVRASYPEIVLKREARAANT